MNHRRTLAVVAATLTVPLLAAACGDSSEPATAADLEGRRFVATDIEGHTIVDGSEVVLSFEEGRVLIEAGCNNQSGDYQLDDGVMVVEGLMATLMACEQALMDQDQLVASIVTSWPEVAIDGDDLTLESAVATMELTAG